VGIGTVVVTGGRGFIAHHVAQDLVRQGKRVLVYDLPATDSPGLPVIEGAEYVDGDVRDFDRMRSVVGSRVEAIFHFAAVVGVDRYLQSPSEVHDVNVAGTRNAIQLAACRDAKVVFASTSEVYGKNPSVPWHETSDTVLGSTERSRWCYAVSKIMAEHLIRDFSNSYSLRATILRLFNVYGPLQRPDFVISRNIHRALNGQTLELYNGGSQTRCFTYVDDVVEAIARAGEPDIANGATINVGSDKETSIRAAMELLREVLETPDLELRTVRRNVGETGYEDVPRRVPSIERAETHLGWRAKTDLISGLTKTVRWARQATSWKQAW